MQIIKEEEKCQHSTNQILMILAIVSTAVIASVCNKEESDE